MITTPLIQSQHHPQTITAHSIKDGCSEALVATKADQRIHMAKKLPILYAQFKTPKTQKKQPDKQNKNTLNTIKTLLLLLSNDPVIHVRKTLVETLKKYPQAISTQIAVSIAEDDDNIAIPFLENISILSDEKTATFITHANQKRHIIIAMNDNIGPKTARAIIEKSPLDACLMLLQNKTCRLNTHDYTILIEKHGLKKNMIPLLTARHDLPTWLKITLTCAMTTKIRLKARKKSNQNHNPVNRIYDAIETNRLIDRAEENALIRILKQSNDKQIPNAVKELEKRGKLIPQLILNALCHGEITPAIHLLSQRAKMPAETIRNIMQSQYGLSRRVIQKRAQLPENLFAIIEIIGDIMHENPNDKTLPHANRPHHEHFVQKMIEHLMAKKIERDKKYTLLNVIAEYGPKYARNAVTEIIITLYRDAELLNDQPVHAQTIPKLPLPIPA